LGISSASQAAAAAGSPAVQGAYLVGALAEFAGQLEGGLVGAEGLLRVARSGAGAAEVQMGVELVVALSDGVGEAQRLAIVVGCRVVAALPEVDVAQPDQRVHLAGSVAAGPGQPQGLLVAVRGGGRLVSSLRMI
jgi:hypothetical protein